MADSSVLRAPYSVNVDSASLRMWGLGGSGYSVNLTTPLDSRWTESFRLLEADFGCAWRFYLDSTHGAVAFSCGSAAVAAEVLEALERLVQSTNRHANDRSRERQFAESGAALARETVESLRPDVRMTGSGLTGR